MEAQIKKIAMWHIKIGFFVIGLFAQFGMHAEPIDLSFDVLFPMTWYQKGLASTMSVWHIIVQFIEASSGQLPLDVIVGKLAFGQFCVARMQKEEQMHAEDGAYFIMVVNKLQSLLSMITVTPMMRDHADCIIDILLTMQKSLDPLYIPSDI